MSVRILMLLVVGWFAAASGFVAFWLRQKSILIHRRVVNPVFASDPDLRRYYGRVGLASEIGYYVASLVALALVAWLVFELFGLVAMLVLMGAVVATGLLLWLLVSL